jgi:hypothetical protein
MPWKARAKWFVGRCEALIYCADPAILSLSAQWLSERASNPVKTKKAFYLKSPMSLGRTPKGKSSYLAAAFDLM